jgi:molybdopterin-containing oxidoreductase family iron-sulfur binding subunit
MNTATPETESANGVSRRTALKGVGAMLGATAFAKAIAPLTEWTRDISLDDFLQRHYKELSPVDLQIILRRLEKETKENYGADVSIQDYKPQPGVKFGYALNLSVCIGCRKCAEACHIENNHDRPSDQSYIRVFEMSKGSLDMEKGNAHYDHPVPQE